MRYTIKKIIRLVCKKRDVQENAPFPRDFTARPIACRRESAKSLACR